MRTVSKRNVQLTIEELERLEKPIISPENIDRTNLGRDKANLRLYGHTIVNLLGKYGNFETDSNGDGLADEVVLSNATDYALDGDYQKAGLVSSAAISNLWYVESPLLSYDHTLFICFDYKNDSNTAAAHIYCRFTNKADGSYISGPYYTLALSTSRSKKTLKIVTPSSGANLCLRLHPGVQSVDDINTAYLWAAKMRVYDLTAMGDLDPTRAAYYTAKYGYSVTKWEELEEDDLANELPYVDGVACVGWDWTSGEKAITIKNRGKNLAPSLIADKAWSAKGELYSLAGLIAFSEMVRVKPSTNYYLSKDGVNANFSNIRMYDKNKQMISEAYNAGAFTTPSNCWYVAAHDASGSVSVGDNIQLEEGSSPTAYEPPRSDKIEIPSGYPIFGYAGVFDELDLQAGVKTKKWERETVTIATGAGTLTKSGTGTAVLIDANGVPYEGTVSGTTLSTSAPDGTYFVWYQLATPKTVKVPVIASFGYLGRVDNQIIVKEHKKDTFIADGVTKTFNLSSTASSTSYTVKVAGKVVNSGVTKTTTSITFTSPPRRNEIIEVIYDEEYPTVGIMYETLETNGVSQDVKFLTDITITEQEEVLDVIPKNAPRKHAVKNRGYEVTLSKALIEAQSNLAYFRDKKFRIKIVNSRDGTTEYLSPCQFKQGLSKNWLEGSETITILAGDYYDNA